MRFKYLCLLVALVLQNPALVFAEDAELSFSEDPVFIEQQQEATFSEETPDNVSVEQIEDFNSPYLKRRADNGVLFSLNFETFDATEYYSINNDTYIKDFIGDTTVSLMGLELGYKRNFQLGSVYMTGSYMLGTASRSDNSLKLTKQGLALGYSADALFNEPYIVPYAQAGIHQFLISETEGDLSNTAATAINLNYRFGLMFQLNWIEKSIDPSTHKEGLRASGLENTFLDIYFSWYEPSQEIYDPADPSTAEADPDLRSEGALGIALKMEF